jgi:hypothetical protein
MLKMTKSKGSTTRKSTTKKTEKSTIKKTDAGTKVTKSIGKAKNRKDSKSITLRQPPIDTAIGRSISTTNTTERLARSTDDASGNMYISATESGNGYKVFAKNISSGDWAISFWNYKGYVKGEGNRWCKTSDRIPKGKTGLIFTWDCSTPLFDIYLLTEPGPGAPNGKYVGPIRIVPKCNTEDPPIDAKVD